MAIQSEVQYAVVNAAATPNNTVVAAVTGKKIRVLSATLVSAGIVTAKFQSGAGGTDLTGGMPMVANQVITLPYHPGGHFETAAAALLNLNLGAAIAVTGVLSYVTVE